MQKQSCLQIKYKKFEIHIMKNSKIIIHIIRLLFLTSIFMLPAMQAWSETLYVSDELSIPMRTGASNKHRIVYFPKSGTALNVKEVSEDGAYIHVTSSSGKEGWVEKQYLMGQSSARDRIVTVNNRLEKSRAQTKELKQQVRDLESQNKESAAQLKQYQREMKSMEGGMEKLKRISANPVALANENKTLEDQVSKLTASNSLLTAENEELTNESTKDWFILGAAVSLGSLLFGLIITRINWKRKRHSWGDF